jgi:flagellin-like protein
MKRLDKRGVSPVVGTVLMIVLTVVLATLIVSYVFGLTGRAAGPTATLEVRATKKDVENINLKIIHRGGDPLKLDELIVYAENNDNKMVIVSSITAPDPIMPGMEFTGVYTHGAVKVGMSVTVRVIHNPSGVLLFDAAVIVKKK